MNILEDDKGDPKNARKFLQVNRELRNNSALLGKVQFIYTGSSSLNITVSNLDSSALINDLNSIAVDPLTKEEAEELRRLRQEAGMTTPQMAEALHTNQARISDYENGKRGTNPDLIEKLKKRYKLIIQYNA